MHGDRMRPVTSAKLSAAVWTLVATVTTGGAESPALARELRLGLITPPTHLWTEAANAFGEELEVASGGCASARRVPRAPVGY